MEESRALKNVTVTPAAEQFMRRIVRFGAAGGDAGFRLVVRPGGCSGLSSEFTVEPAPRADDDVIALNGLKLFLPPDSRALLAGVTIDFTDTRQSSGLTFVDPSAGPCACSSSATGVQIGSLPK